MKIFLQVFVALCVVLIGGGFLLITFLGETAGTIIAVLLLAFIAGIIAVLINQDEKINALEVKLKALESENGIDITADKDN